MVEPNSTIYKQQLSYRREKTKMLSVRWKKMNCVTGGQLRAQPATTLGRKLCWKWN